MVGQKRGLMLPWWAPWVSDLKRVLKFLLQLGLWHLVGLKTTWEKQVYARDLLQMQSSPALASKQHCNELWPLPLSVIFPHTNHRWDACREHFSPLPREIQVLEGGHLFRTLSLFKFKRKTCQGCSFEKFTKGHMITSWDKEHWSTNPDKNDS